MVKVYYEFNKKEDYIIYLGLIIEHLDKYLARYKHYNIGVRELCLEKCREIRPEVTEISVELLTELFEDENYSEERKKYKLVPYYKYMRLSDMLNYISLKILNIIGDRTKEAVSYIKFRDKIKEVTKKGSTLDFELDDLSQEINEKLNICNKSRNYLAHIGDSVFKSQLEYRQQEIKSFSQQFGIDSDKLQEDMQKKIATKRYDYVEVEWMYDLFINYKKSLPIYLSIFQQIKRDYSKITGTKIDIEKFQNRVLPFDYSKITLDSIEMQSKRK